jgi:hypothetical protein
MGDMCASPPPRDASRRYGAAVSPENQLYFANWTLVTQLVGAGAAVCSVAVAGVFGFLTLRTQRVARDANQRANLAATGPDVQTFSAGARLSGSGSLSATGVPGPAPSQVRWVADFRGGESWWLRNVGSVEALDVRVSGLTTLDQNRLHVALDDAIVNVPPTGTLDFNLARRLGASGPGALVVQWHEPADEDAEVTRTQRVAVNPG